MFLKRSDYDRLVNDLAEQRAKREAAETALALARATNTWLQTQVNTLQYERASLLSKVTGAPVLVPTLKTDDSSPISPPVGHKPDPNQFYNQLAALFDDPGDEMASTLGITHDEDGALVYTK